jgi:2-C-methyl-D-erythritol 4-phosphate cytidylyltransferase
VTSLADTFDGRLRSGAAIGVVPVCHDDREAPAGCAALRELRGQTLLVHTVTALLRSGVVGRVIVAVPPVLLPLVRGLFSGAALPAAGPTAVQVIAVGENGQGFRVRAALRQAEVPADRPVVVHDPLHPLAPIALVRAVVDALLGHGVPGAEADGSGGPGSADPAERAVAVPVRPVTDTLKWIDEDDVVLGTADREQFRMVYSPQAYWPGILLRTLEAADADRLHAAGADVLPRLMQAAGCRLLPVPAPGEVFRLTTTEDLVLADAMLQVAGGAGVDEGDIPSRADSG